MALVKGARATTAIEGNTLTDEEVRRIAEQQDAGVPPSREYQAVEVANVINTMNQLIDDVAVENLTQRVTPQLLLSLHERIGSNLGEHFDAIPGQFRSDERIVGQYRCPDADDVPRLVDRLCDWLPEEFGYKPDVSQDMVAAVIQAIVTHVYIEWIHPFGDGNGRTGRMVEFYILIRAGYPDLASHILSDHYNLTRPVYYRKIEQACRERDLTCFIEYAVAGLLDGLLATLRTVERSVFETTWMRFVYDTFHTIKHRKTAVFKRRRALALAFPLDRAISSFEASQLTGFLRDQYATVQRRTLKRDLNVLIDHELIQKKNDDIYRARVDHLQPHMPRGSVST